jgi:uncharacterized membrane protein YagU involved in acid resistance
MSYFGLRKEPRLPKRAGTANDVERLMRVLRTLGFKVKISNDSTTEEVKSELRKCKLFIHYYYTFIHAFIITQIIMLFVHYTNGCK